MGPQNGIMGGDFFTTPNTEIDPGLLAAEQNMAKFSKTKEYKQLKEYIESRIAFYQAYLPDGRAIGVEDADLAARMWGPANIVIGEFKNVLDMYEKAAETQRARRTNA